MNTAPWAATILLAQSTYLRSFGDSFRGESAQITSDDFTTGLMILCVVVVGVWLLILIRKQQEASGRFNSPRKLFAELCRAHELNRRQRRLLRRVARFHGLAQPAHVFLEPQLLNPAKLDKSLRHEAVRLADVYQVLVGAGDPHGGTTRR